MKWKRIELKSVDSEEKEKTILVIHPYLNVIAVERYNQMFFHASIID